MANIDPENIRKDAIEAIDKAVTLPELDEVFRLYLGRKGIIRSLFLKMGDLASEERKEYGWLINELQIIVEKQLKEKQEKLNRVALDKRLEKQTESLGLDVPKIGHLHPISQTIRMMNKMFFEMGFSVMDGPEIETDEYCFKRMNVPENHPARDMQDTIYINEPNLLLRTQTSSIEARLLEDYKPPFKAVCPGRVYRNEKMNKSNHFIFHHYQGVVVLREITMKDLFGTLDRLFKKMYGDKAIVRYRNKYYPEVEPGVGPDMQCFNCHGKGCSVCKGVGWIEMGGAGIIHPNVLKMAGIDPQKWHGFAFGLGLDRWVMAKYKIVDIRTLLGGNLAYKPHENENTL
ncbi:MAG: phenylalanine--tRNA ligase subunit alpha [bacterium]